MDLVIGRSGPISSLIVSRLKQYDRPHLLVGREIGISANLDDRGVADILFGAEFKTVFFLLGSLKVDHQRLTQSDLNALPEVRAVREFLPLISYQRLVFFSSAGAIYGPRPEEVVKESDSVRPISAYGLSKAYIEKIIMQELGGSIEKKTILRIANPFGIYHGSLFNYGFLPALVRNSLNRVPTRIVVPLEYRKDYFSISLLGDVIEAVISDRLGHGIFNVASGCSRSIRDVCEAVEYSLGLPVNTMLSCDNQGIDADSGIICVDRLNQALGINKKISFEEELCHLIGYIKKELQDA